MSPANELLRRITPDPRTEEDSEEVADSVLANPALLEALSEGLREPEDIIRAKTSHALEHIADARPELLTGIIDILMEAARNDPVPMVRWNTALILGNIPVSGAELDAVIKTLKEILAGDESLFVRSRSIIALTYVGMREPLKKAGIAEVIRPYREHKSAIINTKARRAIEVLEKEG